jgi:Transposase DDE domain group 1
MAGRGNHEKTIGQLKSGLAFHTVPTNAYAANSAWQQLVALAHNLLTNFQIDTGAHERTRSRKHTVLHLLQTVQTLRFEVFHRAALLVRPGSVARLRLADNPATRQRFNRIEKALARAA